MEVMKWHLKIEHLNISNEHIINFNVCDNFQSKSDVQLMYDICVGNDIGFQKLNNNLKDWLNKLIKCHTSIIQMHSEDFIFIFYLFLIWEVCFLTCETLNLLFVYFNNVCFGCAINKVT